MPLAWGGMCFRDSGGPGLPLVFLHGTGCDASDWDAVLPGLPAGVRSIRPDFRGHGDSDVPRGAFRLRDLAADVLALADLLSLERMALVGHSLGGMVAICAAGASRRVAALVLLEGWTSLEASRALTGDRYYGGLGPDTEAAVRRKARSTRRRFPDAVWEPFWESVEAFDGSAWLGSARIPVLEAYGAVGRTETTRAGLRVPESPWIRVAWVEGAGHFLPHARPAEVAGLCAEAAKGLEGRHG
jgi:pimeloyl-ACP methyl ester carboxylesterase